MSAHRGFGPSLVRLHIFTKGMAVMYKGMPHTVVHTQLKGMDLYVRLAGVDDPVKSDKLSAPLTEIELKRGAQPRLLSG